MPMIQTYVEKRLACWAVWCHWGSRGAPAGVVSWYEKIVMAPNVQGRGGDPQPCPVDEAEALEINRIIGVLPEHLRDAVIEQWHFSGTGEMKAKRLHISKRAFYDRLALANHKILGYLNDLAADIPLPAPESSHGHARIRRDKNNLTLPHSFRTFPARLA